MATDSNQSNSKMQIPKSDKPRVVVIGGGFGGVRFIKTLKKDDFQIVLIDRYNYHTFQPLLYQVATAGLEPDSIAGTLRKTLQSTKNFYFRMATVTKVLPDSKLVETNIGNVDYDILVIASGSKTNYFGNKDFEEKSFPLKQVPHALNLRSQILQNFEEAVLKNNQEEVQKLMNYVVVGGGPTGVEVSGALGELKMHVLPKDYPELNLNKMQIYLVEGNERLLGAMTESSSAKAMKYLKRFDVNIHVGKIVKGFDGETVTLDDGMRIPTKTMIWAAGVDGNDAANIETEKSRDNRYLVNEYNELLEHKAIYAIGDIAMMKSKDYLQGHPMVAPVAIQQGELLAKNLNRELHSKPLVAFAYKDKGSLATIGRNKAVAEIFGGLKFGGLFAWMLWMFVHLVLIIEFRNKIVIFGNWLWNYFTYDRGTRLIIRPFKNQNKKEKASHIN